MTKSSVKSNRTTKPESVCGEQRTLETEATGQAKYDETLSIPPCKLAATGLEEPFIQEHQLDRHTMSSKQNILDNSEADRKSSALEFWHPFEEQDVKLKWWIAMCLITVAATLTRLYKIEEPSHVCWDETHFGKMGSWYINRTFFFDVHPPLGKMLVGLAGVLTGYNGSFPFAKPGDKYGDTPYVGMRVVCAMFGSCMVPLCYSIVWHLSGSVVASVLAACLILFDTGTLTLSQYILLDSFLLGFIIAATYCLVKFHAHRDRPFSICWWAWLSLTGMFLACAIGVKFVGLFVILLAGFSTVNDLWHLLGNLHLSMVAVLKHFFARVLCLIVLPLVLYVVFFLIHFKVLYNSGSGDGFFSSSFQSQLKGNPLYNASMPQYFAYGSVVTLKNYRTGGAYLHSHWHLYPEGVGARQQQVTTYGHKDENNKWLVKKFDRNPDPNDKEVELVRHGDMVRLEHVMTKRNLHSHREMAPLTRRHYQVTCYGENGTGDANDIFRLDVEGATSKVPVHTVLSVFRLVHLTTGCAVHSHSRQLPKWGWEQLEVTCNPNLRDKANRWNVEEVMDARLPNASFEVYAPSFVEKFVESHAVMLQGNSGLKPKEGEVTSQPWQWPINYRGQPFSGPDFRVYLLGNPVIWWCNLTSLVLYAVMYLYHMVKIQRGIHDPKHIHAYKERVFSGCSWLMLGWCLHYVPFWAMGRILYFHHYFPAFLFSCMLTGVVLEYVVTSVSGLFQDRYAWTIYHTLLGLLGGGIVYSFYLFSPLSYGMEGPSASNQTSVMYGLKWLDSWDI